MNGVRSEGDKRRTESARQGKQPALSNGGDPIVPPEREERVCQVIRCVSFSRNRDRRPETPEGMIVQDADRLDALGAVGAARTFAYGGEHGRPMSESVQHFYDKLLLLKDMMSTNTGKKLAEERHAFLEEFLSRYLEETGGR